MKKPETPPKIQTLLNKINPPIDKIEKPIIHKPIIDEPIIDKPIIDRPMTDKPIRDKPDKNNSFINT